MLAVRGRLDNRQAIVEIGVQRFDLSFNQVEPHQIAPVMPIASYRALIDTGAQRTCLTHRTIAQEGLSRHGKLFIKNVHNENVHSLFLVKLGFWASNETLGYQNTERSYFGLPGATEVINIADNERFDAIIGMDVLQFFDVRFSKTGEFSINLS